MSKISGINGYSGATPIGPQQPGGAGGAEASQSLSRKADRVEISPAARFLNQIAGLPDIRPDKIESIRRALADGTYDVDGKLSIALDRLLEEHADV